MQPSALAEAREWLARAEQDVQATRVVLAAPTPLPAIAAYHSQQAGEKALKAFLAAHNVAFRPTHNVNELLAQCITIDPDFVRFTVAAQTLTPYATRFRYPGSVLEPSMNEAATAEILASQLLQFARQKLGI
jgi:HEPN domain-containing protein